MGQVKEFENKVYIVPRLSVFALNERSLHYHEHVELMIITKGSVTVEVESEKRELTAGDGVLIFPYVAHSYQMMQGDCERFCAVFSSNYFGALNELFANHKTVNSFFTAEQWQPLVAGDGETTLREFCVSEDADMLTQAQAYTRFMAFLLGVLEVCGVEVEKQEEKLYRVAVGYCLENYKNPHLRVQDVAAALGISKATLCRLFSQRHGGVKMFINQARVEYAMVLLRTTDMGVAQIAEKAGFAEVSVFYRAFKRRFGYAPSENR